MKKKIAIPLSITLFAGVLAWWQFGPAQGLGEMEIKALGGRVELVRNGSTIGVAADETTSLEPMDVIRTNGAQAQLRLAGDRDIMLGTASQAVVLSDRAIETQRGRLRAATSDPLRVNFGGVEASSSEGIFRIDRGFSSTRAGAYAGSFSLTAAGQEDLTVDSWLEADVAADDIPREPRPYRLNPNDGWDRQYLGDAIELETFLNNVARGLKSQLGSSRPNLDYFGSLAGEPVPFIKPHLRRPTTDLLIGFTVADNAKGTSLRSAVDDTFDWRDAGGSWGIVAQLMHARSQRVVVALGNLIDGTGAASDGGGGQVDFTLAAAAPGGSGGQPPNGGGNPPPPRGGGNPPGDNDPGDDGDPPPECTDTVSCASQDIQDQLPGGEPEPEPSPSPGGNQNDDPLGLLP